MSFRQFLHLLLCCCVAFSVGQELKRPDLNKLDQQLVHLDGIAV